MSPTLPIVLLAALVASGPAAAPPPLSGFGPERAVSQRELEARFDGELRAEEIGEWIRILSARPHHVGSPYDRENAERIAGWLREWGWEVQIETFDVLFPIPKTRRLALVAPTPFVAGLEETALEADATSGQRDEQLPIYNAYSIDGDVRGELVYVNYGVPDDYLELEKRGISVAGKIVLARYGGSWRGIKPKVAAEHGAVGCLLYSDPRDDGYFQGDPYPEGGYRPPQGAQRGSVEDMPLYPGDPLTPGVGATPEAERLELSEAETLTRIPVLPLSYQDARPLLEALGGEVAPESWRGSLPLTYHLGPGPAEVHLELAFDWQTATLYDVVARLEGSERPNEWVLRGNHHDAWVNGAADPVSGLAAMLAEAKALGALHRAGWRPRRTLVYAAWDGEEPGLLGSTEWVETHADELRAKAVAYVNTDGNGRGLLSIGGSHALEPLVAEVARDVRDPETGLSVLERARAGITVFGTPEAQKALEGRDDLPLDPLGSGSDYTPFLQHLGISSLAFSFGGEGDYGQYHSIYDSFDHYRRFMDPDFAYGVVCAQVGGRLVLRLAEADVLPFRLDRLAATAATYVDEVEKLAAKMRADTAEQNRRIEEGIYAAAWDPTDHWVVPAPKQPVPFLEFAPLRNALSELQARAEAFAAAWPTAPAGATDPELDRRLYLAERALTREAGLPGRPWFVHHLYAPGFYTGYGVKTLPGVREAIEQREWERADEQIRVAAEVLSAAAEAVGRATAALP